MLDCEVFRKISEPALTERVSDLEIRVDALENGDKTKYKTVKRHAKVGERILITDAVADEPYENGDVFTVKEDVVSNGDITVEGMSRWIHNEEYEVIIEETALKVGDAVKLTIAEGKTPTYGWGKVKNGSIGVIAEFKGDGEIEVNFPEQMLWSADESEITKLDAVYDQPAQVGDTIRIIDAHESNIEEGDYRNNDVMVVKKVNSEYDVVETDKHVGYIFDEEFVIIGRSEDVEPTLKVGEYAKVIQENHSQKGEIVKVVSNTYDTDYVYRTETLDGKDGDCFEEEDLAPVTDAEVKDAKLAAELEEVAEKFPKGAKVRITVPNGENTKHDRAGVSNDEIGTVEKVRKSIDKIIVEIDFPSYGSGWNGSPDELEVLSEEEAKFAKIGRNKGEFKKGDIAEVICSPIASPVGTFVEIKKVCADGSVFAEGCGTDSSELRTYLYNNGRLKLIAPVDARVDREDVA